jgi:hypothetical protein
VVDAPGNIKELTLDDVVVLEVDGNVGVTTTVVTMLTTPSKYISIASSIAVMFTHIQRLDR